MSKFSHLINRTIYGGVGVGFGLVTIMPNFMLSDSGTRRAVLAAKIGLCASGSFVVGGVCSTILNNPVFLIPGVALQVGAFTIPYLINET